MDQIDADVQNLWERLDSWIDGFFRLLPNLALAIVVLLIFIGIGVVVGRFVRRVAKRHERESLGHVGGALAKWTAFILGLMLAVTVVAPSIQPVDLLAGLGVSSVAIGFAFKDILQNMLAGILILLRQPFAVGDEIVSGSHEGVVEKIETRATFLKTYDGRRVVIPNTQIYTDSVVVKTAFDKIRSEYDVGVGCSDDWARAKKLAVDAVASCEGVLRDPAPEAIPIAIADFSNNIRLRWWTASDRPSVIHTFGRVIEAVYRKLDEHGIDMPYPTHVTLFHDQTEEVDGDRSRQREGWPAGGDEVPRSARVSEAILRSRDRAGAADGDAPRAAGSSR